VLAATRAQRAPRKTQQSEFLSTVERTVFIHLPDETEAVPAGRLTIIEQGLQAQASAFA
jgi:hypothetical protein